MHHFCFLWSGLKPYQGRIQDLVKGLGLQKYDFQRSKENLGSSTEPPDPLLDPLFF